MSRLLQIHKTLLAGLVAVSLLASSARASSITLNFNSTGVAAGDALWFNSVVDVTGGADQNNVTIYFTNSKLSFTDDKGNPQTVNVPNAILTYSSAGSDGATTSFNNATNTWVTNITGAPVSGSQWMSGLQLVVPAGHDYKNLNITWSADFNATGAVTLNWKGAAADYVGSTFKGDPNDLNVKASDGIGGSDHAGTPEAIAVNGNLAGGGATGGAGSNWTGSYSGTVSVTPGGSVPGPGLPLPSAVLGGAGLFGLIAVRRTRRPKAM